MARKILNAFATRAYRRPARPEEVDRLVSLVELAKADGDSFESGIRLALQAVLVSPHFLFRIELDRTPDPDGAYSINDYELASRLSYFLWSSMPDEELFAHARQGTLRDNLEPQVRRMLADQKSKALVQNFAGQWLQIRNLDSMTPDRRRFPQFDPHLRASMRTETELFVESIIRDDRSVLNFLDADFTYLNERLARHYGIAGITGDQFRRVSLLGRERGGVLTQGSILTLTSNPTRTSPVKRGKWVLENILGTPPPPPPPGIPELSETETAVLSGSVRARMEAHRSNAMCASCHARMDPIGFGLENFDAVGGWRATDGQFPVDASGTLPTGESFSGPAALRQVLKAHSDQFVHCLTERMLTYALGRGIETYDNRVVDEIAQKLGDDGFRFSRLVVEITKSDPFQLRQALSPPHENLSSN